MKTQGDWSMIMI